jgi:type I restriction enzyme S subunit
MPTYTCEKCARTFKQKSGYDDHKAKKNDCIQNTMIHAIVETKVQDAIRAIQPKPQITDKTLLPSFFEDLHNLLWNKAGLNPESALAHMTFFFAYRLIEQQADALGLPQECRWSYVANIRNEQDLFDTVKRGVNWFRLNPKTKSFFKPHEIKKCEIVAEIVQQINRISLTTLQETDTLGDVFEYMLGRGMSTMSDEGQYFTNREICKLSFKLAFQIKKKLRRDDGSLCTFADWFCGTGGFPAEYVKGVKTHLQDVDWRKDCESIYCQDMNTSSVTTTLLNMLILTGIPFSDQNIRSSNSFSDAITTGAGAPFPGLSLDYCFMNPPYGGDKTKGKEYKFAYSKTIKADDDAGTKTKRFYVNQEIQSIGIEDDDKVSAGVQLGMATLSSVGGVCCLVLPQGFFFGASKKCVDLRKKIAEEYKIWYVVDIASGSFLNTGTKTSMIVFQKGVGATEKISFIGLDEKLLVEATLEELRAKNYSLNYKQYLAQSVAEVEGFEMVKLEDIVKPSSMKHRNTPDGNKTGKYPLISSALNVEYYMDTYDSETPSLIFNTINADGNCSVHYYEKFNVTSNTYVLSCLNKLTLQYIYYYLKTQPELLKRCFEGTTKKALSRPLLQSIDIPLPSFERQQQIVESIDGFAQLAHHEEQALKMLEKQVMFFVKEMGRGQPRVKLGEVCEFQRGKMITKKELVDGEFPVIGGGLSPMGYHTSSNRKVYTCLISQSGENAGHISRYTKPVWASDCFSVSSSKMNDDFLYYSLLQIQDEINFLKTGTAQPHIYPSSIDSLTIVVPPLAEQQTLQSDFEEIRHKHAKIDEYKKKAQDAIKRLIPGA